MRPAISIPLAVVFAFSAAPAAAQWSLGGFYGYGWYNSGTIFGAAGNLEAGILNRFAAGAFLTDDQWEYVSGELRYVYHDGHPFLKYQGRRVDLQGQSHAITYDALFHLRNHDHKLRPYVAAGLGAKAFLSAGPSPFPQPFPEIATLNNRDQWKFTADIGFGARYRIGRHVELRGDFRDYITTFPSVEMTPAPHGTARGVFNQFTPMFGVSYVFPDRSW